jgi:hypothetical protein
MMEVKLIRYTPDALDLLIGTKTTRMRGKSPEDMSDEEKQDHWKYMLDTIRSPFEFVDYIFDIRDVSKNMTHQLVRTRTGAYQQETGRALQQSAFDAIVPDAFRADKELYEIWCDAMADADASYNTLLEHGGEMQDARAVLPHEHTGQAKPPYAQRYGEGAAMHQNCWRISVCIPRHARRSPRSPSVGRSAVAGVVRGHRSVCISSARRGELQVLASLDGFARRG